MSRLRFPGAGDPDAGMGHFRESVHVSHRAGGRFEPLEALVDTGATYTWIPRDVLEGLGVVAEEQRPFVLSDGREVRYPLAWVQIRLGTRVQPTIVAFGEPGSEPILGVVTLEEFGLAVDRVNRRLIAVPGLLKGATESVHFGVQASICVSTRSIRRSSPSNRSLNPSTRPSNLATRSSSPESGIRNPF